MDYMGLNIGGDYGKVVAFYSIYTYIYAYMPFATAIEVSEAQSPLHAYVLLLQSTSEHKMWSILFHRQGRHVFKNLFCVQFY